MNRSSALEKAIYAFTFFLALLILALVASEYELFSGTKLVYQGF